MRKFSAILLLLAVVASTQAVEIVLWDFETGLGGWGPGAGTVTLGTNPLTGSQCMVIQAPAGWQTGAYNDSAGLGIIDLIATPVIQLEVTYIASEWGDVDWITQDIFIINSGGGWGQKGLSSGDGGWGAGAGDATRTLQYDFTGYNLSGWGPQLSIMLNGNSPTSGIRGNYYIDNIKAIGPDPVTPWYRFECEDGVLNAEAFITDDADCSGGQYVLITSDQIEGSVTMSVNVRDAGTYNMRYGQSGFEPQRYESIYVNGVEQISQQFAGLVSWGAAAAIEGNNGWGDLAVIEDLFGSVELYGDVDGDWQLWSRFAEAWNTTRLNTPLTVDLKAGLNTIEIRTVWGWDNWDYIELELGVQPRNPSPADGSIAVIADATALSWDNAVHNLDSIEVWFGETPVEVPGDPNTVLSGDTYKTLLSLLYSATAPGQSTSIPMPALTHGKNYTWVVDGVIEGDVDPNDVFYGGPFWSFYATDNAPPIAVAGEDQYKWLLPPDPNVAITLDGSGSSDDGKDAPLTYSWTQTAGPGAIIDAPAAATTSVTLTGGMGNTTEAGAGAPYVFQLEIYDGLFTRTDTVTVFVNSNSCTASVEAGSGYSAGDIASAAGVGISDCKVDLYDFLEMATHWLGCTNLFEACN